MSRRKLGFWRIVRLMAQSQELLLQVSENADEVLAFEERLRQKIQAGEKMVVHLRPDQQADVLKVIKPLAKLARKVRGMLGGM